MAYTYGGAKATNDFYVDASNNTYYDKFSVTIAPLVIVNAETDQRLDTVLDLKANLNSPALTGIPTVPTASIGTNTTQIASTAFVQNAIDNFEVLPSDTGLSNIFLTSNNGTKSWTSMPSKVNKKYNITTNTTSFTLTTEEWPSTASLTELLVFRNGVLLSETDDYTYDLTTRTITLVNTAISGDIVMLKLYFGTVVPAAGGGTSGGGSGTGVNIEVVDALPANPVADTFYFVKVVSSS